MEAINYRFQAFCQLECCGSENAQISEKNTPAIKEHRGTSCWSPRIKRPGLRCDFYEETDCAFWDWSNELQEANGTICRLCILLSLNSSASRNNECGEVPTIRPKSDQCFRPSLMRPLTLDSYQPCNEECLRIRMIFVRNATTGEALQMWRFSRFCRLLTPRGSRKTWRMCRKVPIGICAHFHELQVRRFEIVF